MCTYTCVCVCVFICSHGEGAQGWGALQPDLKGLNMLWLRFLDHIPQKLQVRWRILKQDSDKVKMAF